MDPPSQKLPQVEKSRIIRQPRATTPELLASAPLHNFRMPLIPPRPIPTDIPYTKAQVLAGLTFAHRALKQSQRLSPTGKKSLVGYKSACTSFLNVMDEEQIKDKSVLQYAHEVKNNLIEVMRTYEDAAQWKNSFRFCSTESLRMRDHLIRLRKHDIYCRHWDMIQKLPKSEQYTSWQQTPAEKAFWIEVSEKLEREVPYYKRPLEERLIDIENQVHFQIYKASQSIGFDYDDTLSLIEHHQEPDRPTIESMVQRGKYHTLQKILYQDLTDLPMILDTIEEEKECGMLKDLLQVTIEKLFEWDQVEDVDNWCSWIARSNIQEYRKDLRGCDGDDAEKKRRAVTEQVQKVLLGMVQERRQKAE